MKLWREEKGTALILMALGMSAIMGFAALVTDLGLMYLNKVQVSNAADAAALAGVQALPGDELKARNLAQEYAAKNGVESLSVSIAEDKKSIVVQGEKTVGLMLARVLGRESSTSKARAEAVLEPLTGVKGVVPLGVSEQEFIFGETYVLKYAASDDPEGEYHSGWLGLLALQGPGAKLYLEDLKYGFGEEIQIGDILDIQTGNISGKTFEGIQYRIDRCTHLPYCTAESFREDCPRVMLVPVIRPDEHKKVVVIGFAAFLVDSVEGMGNENYITGKFVRRTTSGSSSPTGPDNGLFVPRLSK